MKNTAPMDRRISSGLQKFQPILSKARLSGRNESDTVTIIADILAEVFGFDKYEQITSELPVKRTYCDLAVRIDGDVCLLIECKAVGVDLREEHVNQATGYAANSGIDYVVLTNGVCWRIYRVLFGKPVETVLVCEFDFCNLSVNRPQDYVILRSLCLESFSGRENASLDDLYAQRRVLNRYIVGQLLLNDWMVNTIRQSLKRHFPDVKITSEDLRRMLQDEVLRREVVSGDMAGEAAQIVSAANTRMKAARNRAKQ